MKQKLLAFLCGDIVVTLWLQMGGIFSDLGHFSLKVVSVIIMGIAGGVAGLAGKDIYTWIKAKIKKK